MNKFICFVVCLIASFSVFASEIYVGGDINHSISGLKLGSLRQRSKHTAPVLNVYAGYGLMNKLSAEAGLFTSMSINRSKVRKNGQTKIKGGHLSLVYLLPIASKLEGLAGAGVGCMDSHAFNYSAFDFKRTLFVPRLMTGAQYEITNGLKIRGSVVYHRARSSYSSTVKMFDTYKFGIGLNYILP